MNLPDPTPQGHDNPWRPSISVVIPVYNGATFLAATIASVLQQSCLPQELLVVDDGSTDNSADIAAAVVAPPATRVRLIRQANQGPAAARNRGIAEATGEFLAFLDADDLWLPDKLSLQVAMLAEQPALDGVICRMACFVEPGGQWPKGRNQAHFDQQPAATNFCTLLLRRAALARVGHLDPAFRTSEDTEWAFRARDAGLRLGVVDSVLLRRRFHANNLSHSKAAAALSLATIARMSLNRRRLASE
jgi:glycosyltransferase involved in cell wall biosynthesis